VTDEQMKKIADAGVKYTMTIYKNDNNNMGLYAALLGLGNYKLERKPGYGHDYDCYLEAIYRYHRDFPEEKIDEYLYNTFLDLARCSVDVETLSKVVNIIFSQLRNQKEGISPFEVEMKKVLEFLKNNIINDQELLGDKEYMSKVNEYDEILDRNYGHKIL
jgi:hypothetical protein